MLYNPIFFWIGKVKCVDCRVLKGCEVFRPRKLAKVKVGTLARWALGVNFDAQAASQKTTPNFNFTPHTSGQHHSTRRQIHGLRRPSHRRLSVAAPDYATVS
jgi:hypothetical protein